MLERLHFVLGVVRVNVPKTATTLCYYYYYYCYYYYYYYYYYCMSYNSLFLFAVAYLKHVPNFPVSAGWLFYCLVLSG